ncbi:MAG: hypothetical protein J7574_14965 [Flavobacterium sp.]|uniref:hypothetical protein n=1 Tax=Flavobacterium sp. TaxID=239 RepID=UPI001B056018|nr:hypothetical protein [Flavobacterium sp.]MBO9585463.1 hypothetical protein [Flavobacterium sp.]
MKISLISFDFFSFDHHIILELQKRNIEAEHIDISKFKYKYTSIFDRAVNLFNKKVLKKNKKVIEMEKDVLKRLQNLGPQDIILTIRPDCLSKETHLKIKQHTNKYIAYIYDSCQRFPIDHLLNGIFDEIFSFDLVDVKKYNFSFISNYIYNQKKELTASNINENIFIIISIDERFNFLNNLADYLSSKGIKFKFIAIGKKAPKNINSNIIFQRKKLFSKDLQDDLENSKIFLDLIRHGHNGLSFRIFEALAMQRKIITTNQTISQYDFYNPNNILILDENKTIDIDPDFFATPYQPLSDDIYYKYTIENWVKTVFKL